MSKKYVNYHRHTHYSNITTLDCVVKPKDYIERTVELGHDTFVSLEHGTVGNVFEAHMLCEKSKLNLVIGTEAYFVPNRFEKDRRNFHIVLLAVNENGRRAINKALSEANLTGYYYKARIDEEILFNLPGDDVMVTTACCGGIANLDEEFLIRCKNHFKYFYLEIQAHVDEVQVEFNKKILDLHKRLEIPLIHGNDSHYVKPEDSKYRTLFLKAKGISYPEESSFILDFPSYDEIIERYKKQNVVSNEKVIEALDNTLIIGTFTQNINKEIKMPKISKNSNKELKELIQKKWNEEKKNIPKEKHKEYIEGIKYEMDIVQKTHMEDYFLLDYQVVKDAIEKYDCVITRTGRGCFTEDALVHTETTMKSIKDVKIGDKVITKDGRFERVYNTMSYDIEEELIQIKHLYGTDKYHPTICTLDHKILINRNNNIMWVEAKNILKTDYVCVPKIKNYKKNSNVIDLNDYNDFEFKYDDKYIYERVSNVGIPYKYSPSDVARKIGVGRSLIENFANLDCKKKLFARKPEKLKELMEYIPFETREEYAEFVENKKIKKINRFIDIDRDFNTFIGLMYGDGFTDKDGCQIGLAINSETIKNVYNRSIFEKISQKFNISITEVKSKSSKLIQLYMNSKIITNFVKKELFESSKGKEKMFNTRWFYQDVENLEGLIDGLVYSDGHFESENKHNISFDNTSLSIINAYKLLYLMTNKGVNSLSFRQGRIDKRGYNCKDSYKLRINLNSKHSIKKSERTFEDNNYYYLPIKEIIKLPKTRTKVYDISVENEPSYLLNNMVVHNSAPSFYINKLLGLTDLDRFDSPVTLYPTRFMSIERILQTRSLADIDINVADRKPLIKATKDLLGEDGCHWLLTYKPMQKSSGFRMWCKAIGMHIDEYNEIAKNIDDYVEDVKWKDIIEDSKVFVGVIESMAPSPCSFLLLDTPISEEVGLIKVKDEICCMLDGYYCDAYKYLKND